MSSRLVLLAALPALLAGCDLLGIETASQIDARKEAEGRAIGSACRHAVRSIEDCYVQNPKAGKAAVFSGWREMDEYMRQNDVAGMPYAEKKLPMITEKPEKADEVVAAPAAARPPAGATTAVGGASPTRATTALPGTTPPRVAPGTGTPTPAATAGAATRPSTTPAAPPTPQAPASPQRPATPQRNG